ncbi:Pls/PosA family non-ribosomal peptide synthetase [Streptomyces sp. NPDC096030]|uniref:Pls/PosA family non-ribosomal peptide synthetase n=1 Tax=Streptomyces sp. NPDC096030 TaxID=3155423 RepID=UPI0033328A52
MTQRSLDVEKRAGTDTQGVLAQLLGEVACLDDVPVDSHFFDDLGADSLVMAHFCARARKQAHLPTVSMRDIYRYPTIRSLSTALADDEPVVARTAPADDEPAVSRAEARPASAETRPPAASEAPSTPAPPPERAGPVLCGAVQLLCFVGYAFLLAFVAARGYDWISTGSDLWEDYLRSVVFGAVALLLLCTLPVVAKWMLIGRWEPRRIPVWSLAYVRFWLVKTLIRANPLALSVGSPLYVLYLRALGARIGRGVTIMSRSVPVCTDLLTVGDRTVIRKDVLFSCYRAQDAAIETGPVTLGRDVVVSEATVLDVRTSMGDGAQLGHASSLHPGQSVPGGEHWHGSPGQPTDADFLAVDAARCGTVRRAFHGAAQIVTAVMVLAPLVVGFVDVLLSKLPQLTTVLEPGPEALADWVFYVDLLLVTGLVLLAGIPVVLIVLATVPRLLSRLVAPGRVYPLFGFHHAVHRTITLLSNRRSMTRLFGDSTAIVHYLRWIGYDLSAVEQTGSNFGTVLKHESPFLSSVGRGTMVADGLSVMNADYSSSSFRVARTEIGAHNFLGNRIAYPSRGRTGDNCLLATKVMVPVNGPLRHDVGLLGSPSFEIPRSVMRDSSFDDLARGDGLRRRLHAKNRHNAATAAWHLLTGWLYFFAVTLLYAGAADLYAQWGVAAIAVANIALLPFTILYYVLVERLITAVHPLGALFCSIYDVRFWRRERYWKVPSEAYLQVLNGTPFKNTVLRMLGARIGTGVFDDGCGMPERAMVTIGDGCTLNAGSGVQCHSQEDGTFKSDVSRIGAGCTLGVGAFVHYGVTVGDGAHLATDCFLMKGETVPEHARWAGNPARPTVSEHHVHGGEPR